MDKRKLAKELLQSETPGYGIYISSNESDSKGDEKTGEITIGTDSNKQEKSDEQDTEAFSAQLWEALFENEMRGGTLS